MPIVVFFNCFSFLITMYTNLFHNLQITLPIFKFFFSLDISFFSYACSFMMFILAIHTWFYGVHDGCHVIHAFGFMLIGEQGEVSLRASKTMLHF